MKIGDKVYCKENLFINKDHTLAFLKGVKYEVVDYNTELCYVYSLLLNRNFRFLTENRSNFWKSHDINKFDFFNNYFLTEREIRKNKLMKINERKETV
jgi:hypothetical protein